MRSKRRRETSAGDSRDGRLAVALAAFVVAACAPSEEPETTAADDGEHDASATPTPVADASDRTIVPHPDGEPPRRWVEVRLGPVVSYDYTASGYADTLESLDGARVCLDRWRPKAGTWDDWTILKDDEQPCADSVANHETVIHAPENSEGVITVHRDGYVPLSLSLLVGEGPLNFGSVTGYLFAAMPMEPEDVSSPYLPLGRSAVEGESGGIFVIVAASSTGNLSTLGFHEWASLGEATLRLRGGGEGPFYFAPPGLYDPALDHTVGRALEDPDSYQPVTYRDGVYAGLAEGLTPIAQLFSGATFLGLDEGDHYVEVSHPGATCDLSGYQVAQPNLGYFEGANTIRVPVLAGHATFAGFFCSCDASDRFEAPEYADPTSCRLAPLDAGSD